MRELVLNRWSVYALVGVLLLSFVMVGASHTSESADATEAQDKVILAVHGGAGGGSAAKDQLMITSDHDREIPVRSARDGGETERDGITANVIDAGMGLPGDIPDDVEGNIAFIKRGESNFLKAAERVTEKGAIGLIIADDKEDSRPFRPGLSGEAASIPVVGITQADGEMLLSKMTEGEVEVNLKVDKEVYRQTIREALEAGMERIDAGSSSVEAVEAAVNVLEDSPLFNAGKGAVFNEDGAHELDASIMNGEDLQAGAVAGSKHAKNPITLARTIMEKSEHVMLGGDSADWFGREHGVEMVTQDYFHTQERWGSLMRAKEKDNEEASFGTVGAVANDQSGNLAAATSTGGLTNKSRGRIGDSPIIGAGTYANNNSVAVSATGTGEVFIRGTAAVDISALMEYGGLSVAQAADKVIHEKLMDIGGTGGVIALDKDGNFASPYSTTKMVYGYVTENGEYKVVLSEKDEQDDGDTVSAAEMITRVKDFAKEGEFDNDEVARSLTTHLTAVSRYETTETANKVVKHMQGFISLLDHQKKNEMVTEKAYNSLYSDAESLLNKWQ